MKTSMIPGMSHKIILQLASVALLAAASTGTAETITITPDLTCSWRYDQYTDQNGTYGPYRTYPIGHGLTGLVAGDNADYRTIWQFKLDTLGITADDVISATLNWTGTPIWGGYLLGIDRVNSDFNNWDAVPMYGGGAPITNYKFNGSGSNDLTSTFKFVLTNSTATSGLALRFYIEGASPAVNVAGNISNVTIQVTTRPSYALWASTNAGGQTADLDWDNDGVTNGVEYFMNAAPGFTANPVLDSSNKITWTNGDNIRSSEYGTRFVVQTSADLTTWEDVAEGDLDSNNGSLSYILTGAGKQFARLKVMP